MSATPVTVYCAEVGDDFVRPSTSVCDLSIYLDADLSMREHVQWTVAGCFAALHKLRSIRRSIPTSVYQTLGVALVLSRLGYGNATLAGISGQLSSSPGGIWTPPRALLLDFDAQTTSLPRSLTFTGCVHLNVSSLSWRPWSTGHCTAWRHITFLMTYAVSRTYPADETCGQRLRASWKCQEPVSRLSVIELSPLPDLDYGTVCRVISLNAKLLKFLNENLNIFSLVYHFLDSSW